MTGFKNILFPTDGSENSVRALEYVKQLAKNFSAGVTLLNVYELPILLNGYEMTPNIYDEISASLELQSKELLEKVKGELKDYAASVDTVSLQGNVGRIILNVADEKGCDVVVMGSRGMGTVKSFLIGSVSNYVVHHAKGPVLVVH